MAKAPFPPLWWSWWLGGGLGHAASSAAGSAGVSRWRGQGCPTSHKVDRILANREHVSMGTCAFLTCVFVVDIIHQAVSE